MRIRTIKPEFWKSESMCGLSAGTRLLAIGLLNYADDEGFFLAHPALIRGELMPFDAGTESIPGMLQELVGIGYLELIVRENRTIGRVVNFRKHQLVNRPQKSKLAALVNAHGAITDDSVNAHGAITDDSVNAHGAITDDSVNAHGAITAGMDQGSGNGSGNGKGMEGSGEASQGKPGELIDAAASSMPEGQSAGCNAAVVEVEAENPPVNSNTVADEPAEKPKKKEGAGRNTLKREQRTPEPEWPADLPQGYREALLPWWNHKRELRQGYKAAGWAALVARERQFPVAQVRASVEASMANNWAGLFTANTVVGQLIQGGDLGAKKGRGAAAVVIQHEPARMVSDVEPEGWGAVWPELYAFPAPSRWSQVPEANRRDVLAALQKKKRGRGFECPVPCDWRVVWAELYVGLPSPETWDGVADVARREIVARIEERKKRAES